MMERQDKQEGGFSQVFTACVEIAVHHSLLDTLS